MTEQQGSEVVEILRSRLGAQYHAGLDEGRREIARVVGDEMNLGRDEADTMVGQLISAGLIRYVTGDERDPVEDREAQHDEYSDQENRRDVGRSDGLGINAIPGQGGASTAPSDQIGGVPAAGLASGTVVSGAGTGTPAAAPLAIAAAGADASGAGAGYWDFSGGTGGVVPSSTRKGQVEPRGI